MKVDFKKNSLNYIRLLAALQVMYGHLTEYLDVEIPGVRPVISVFYGVPIFFTLSGFLIWNSISNSRDYKQYLLKRFWRIFPELWVGVAIEIIAIVLLYRPLSVKDLAAFTVTQATYLQFWTPDSLRGYGVGTPNGALWTICVLIQFYIIAWFVRRLLAGGRCKRWLITLIISIVASIGIDSYLKTFGVEILVKLFEQTVVRYFWMFLLGMMLANYFDIVIAAAMKSWWLALGISIILRYTYDLDAGYPVFSSFFLLFAVVGFAYRFTFIKLKRDISYGLYIYHMTVVNVMVTFGLTGKLIYLIIAFVLSFIMAYLSNITIGKLSESRKKANIL